MLCVIRASDRLCLDQRCGSILTESCNITFSTVSDFPDSLGTEREGRGGRDTEAEKNYRLKVKEGVRVGKEKK